MKRILVPTDFSEHANYAMNVAAQIAKKTNSDLYLLNLLDLPTHMNDAVSSGVNIPEVMLFLKKTQDKLALLRENGELNGIHVVTEARSEKAFEGIATYSKEHNIDLIVMGSHGASGFNNDSIGSIAEKTVRTSDIPVLVVKSHIPNFKAENFVFASDFSNEIRKPFQKLVDFANIFDADLNLVMINTPNSFKSTMVAEKIMKDFLKDFVINKHSVHIYNDTNVEKGVLNFANKVDADIIGVCTHGRTGFAHFFNGSISEDLVSHAIRPVVTFKI
ncbi:MAG: universal stress protein UspA [Flavobacterium sp. BFFFF1]|uniref:universal stress protein n=1 Tax=unclassified Flavobacterium TaxID=196869 RepID=UPI000BD0AED1|nr:MULTISPECIES: universal stress protein [unclassified Flavobacterium]OYU82262.1 MAG: universal stress protein UspA [Flavobacterium sp. BFFFF1]